MYKKRKSKYTDTQIQEAVRNSLSVAEVLRTLGIKDRGGHKGLRQRIKQCDTAHFKGQGWSRGRKSFRIPNEKFFVKGVVRKSHVVRLRLLNAKIKSYACERCGLSEWLGQKIPLECNHINGNKTDNRLDNSEVICPNCHCFTPTYKIKNWKK